MPINRAAISKELLPGLNAVFGMEYGEVNNEHESLYEVENSDRCFEEEQDLKINEKVLKRRPDDKEQKEIWSKSRGGIYKAHAWNYFRYKWDNTWLSNPEKIGWIKYWSDEFKNNPPDPTKSKCKIFMKYIYFEKDLFL